MRRALLALAFAAFGNASAGAEVHDAVYRGTLVCDKLPFTHTKMREAIRVTIDDGKITYSHVVRLGELPEPTAEKGEGSLIGPYLTLDGAWDGGSRRYKASYSGTFIRRSARLKGTQIWAVGGKDITRACHGSIKRPFKVFLPRPNRS